MFNSFKMLQMLISQKVVVQMLLPASLVAFSQKNKNI